MEQRTRILTVVLLTAVLCLGAARTAYRMQQHSIAAAQENSEPRAPSQQGVQLYVENGLWGARTPSGRVLAEPIWYYLRVMSDDVLIAKKQVSEDTRAGLIRTNGELLVPFLYRSIEQAGDDLWIAELPAESGNHCHLYRSDGTRWSDTEWESCETDADGNAMLSAGDCSLVVRQQDGKAERMSWHSLHSVGLHSLRLDFDAAQLAVLPDSDTLLHLGDAAAGYLTYLFIDDGLIEPSLISGENPESLYAAPRYQSCFLQNAAVSRVRLLETAGFPTYLLQLRVSYRWDRPAGGSEDIDTAMYLTVSRNAAGGYTYSGFSDALSEQIR